MHNIAIMELSAEEIYLSVPEAAIISGALRDTPVGEGVDGQELTVSLTAAQEEWAQDFLARHPGEDTVVSHASESISAGVPLPAWHRARMAYNRVVGFPSNADAANQMSQERVIIKTAQATRNVLRQCLQQLLEVEDLTDEAAIRNAVFADSAESIAREAIEEYEAGESWELTEADNTTFVEEDFQDRLVRSFVIKMMLADLGQPTN